MIVCLGKGPQKDMYSKKIEERSWNRVQFCLPWLTAEDYPLMLGKQITQQQLISDVYNCLNCVENSPSTVNIRSVI